MQASRENERYELLLKGGHVIDPANQVDAVMDVAVANGKIAAVEKNIAANHAGKVVDVTGLYVTPGLIDIHCHLGHGGAPLNWFAPEARCHEAPLGIPADLALQSGVTTVVDAGSAGADTFPQQKQEVIDEAPVRVLTFLNIVANGMRGGLEQSVDQMDPQCCVETIEKHKSIIVGVKTAHYWTNEPWDTEHPPWAAVDRAIECGKAAVVPVMFDFWPRPDRSYADLLLTKMRPGDIHTHVFAQQFPIILSDGKLNPIVNEARRRGVVFDVGHGAASFWFRNAAPAVKQGFIPDSISTDLHTGNYTVLSMAEVISKFLAMGVPLEDLIVRSTVNPAREIGRPELGTLSIGAEADIAVLEKLQGDFAYIDCGCAKMRATAKVIARMTVRAGRILYDPSGLSMIEWEKARPEYFKAPMFGNSPPSKADDYPREFEARRSSAPASTQAADYYEKLGVTPFINAAGTYTALSASTMPAVVQTAVAQAAQRFANIHELLAASGEYLAKRLRCEAALVTAGAAAALTLGTAACVTLGNPDAICRIPADMKGLKDEVIIQKAHHCSYDHAVRNAGVHFVDVETLDDYEKAFTERTAMAHFFNAGEGKISREDWIRVAHDHGVPCFNDAAADVPPVSNLWNYTQMGFDLVTFSGGKGLRGPQCSGLLLGRKDLIEAARRNSSPNSNTIGRSMKVGKEQIVGLVAAVDWLLGQDEAGMQAEFQRRAERIADHLKGLPTIKTQIFVPEVANHVPHLIVTYDPARIKISGAEIMQKMREGKPRIELNPATEGTPASAGLPSGANMIVVGVWMMQPGEDSVVARRLREVLLAATSA